MNHDRQNDRLLSYLKKNRKVDPMTALTKLGIGRLAARIYDLRNDVRYKVDIRSVPKRTVNRYGESIIVSSYELVN
jgi:hypothetical protein